ncbi:hypothetical protein BASA84_001000 [Batrachochytrium salamandrivorans]|nr:hypothetical protein BASA84_001000 [Batrachochytrium salamandrivorans]
MAPDRLHFTVAKTDFHTCVQVWAQLGTDTLFEDYKIESVSDNHIWLEVKEGLPVLSFSITNQSRIGKLITLVQDVPVRVISPDKTHEFREPATPDFDVHILMPPIISFRNIAERMKAIGQRLVISANMSGQLTMGVSNDIVKIQTFFKDLINPLIDPMQADALTCASTFRNKAEFAEVEVDIRDFIKFAQCYQLHPSKILCCISEQSCLIFYVIVGDEEDTDLLDDRNGSLTYRIPLRTK